MTTSYAFDYPRPMSVPQPTAPALVSSDHVHELIRDLRDAYADAKSARVRSEVFRRANADLLEHLAVEVRGTLHLPGGPAVVLSTGAVRQFVTRVIETPDGIEYAHEWVDVAPIPGTPAAIVAAAEIEAATVGGLD
jgi:hypothetical protein